MFYYHHGVWWCDSLFKRMGSYVSCYNLMKIHEVFGSFYSPKGEAQKDNCPLATWFVVGGFG